MMDATSASQAPPLPSTGVMHPRRIIQSMLEQALGVDRPKKEQIDAIEEVVFNKKNIVVKWPTGFGKSIVPLGIATMLKGVSIVVTPLLALSSDQMRKVNANRKTKKLCAIYCESMKGYKFKALSSHLLASISRKTSVILFISPHSLKIDSNWHRIIRLCASKRLVKLVTLEEAHAIPLEGRDFRPAQKEIGKNLVNMIEAEQPGVAQYVALSATLPKELQAQLEQYTKVKFDTTFWEKMERRSIDITVDVVGKPNVVINEIAEPYMAQPSVKQLWFSNSRERAEGGLNDILGKLASKYNGESIPFTGTTGIKEKVFLIDLFSGIHVDEDCNLKAMPVTQAAYAGISSDDCKLVGFEGFPPSMIVFVQFLGRAGRALRESGTLGDQCAVVLSLPLYTMLLNRINDVEKDSERRRQHEELQEVLRILVLPKQCLHVTIEEKYEDPDVPRTRYPCNDKCPYCRGDHLRLTGKVKRAELVDALGAILNDGTPLLKTLVKGLLEDDVKSKVFTMAKSNVKAGHVHALILQLIIADIIHVNDAGGTTWSTCVKNGSRRLAHCDDERWQGINYE